MWRHGFAQGTRNGLGLAGTNVRLTTKETSDKGHAIATRKNRELALAEKSLKSRKTRRGG